jgi:hypothetical protein
VGSRTDLVAGHPSNAPLWNPGPGAFKQVCVCVCQGAFASPTGFHRAGKLVKDNKLILPVELREKGALLRA